MTDETWQRVFSLVVSILCLGTCGVTVWYLVTTPFFGSLFMPIAVGLAGCAQLAFAVVLIRRAVRKTKRRDASGHDGL